MALYNANGSINVTVVDGSSLVGAYAADGSMNVTVSDPDVFCGFFAPDGSRNITVTDGSTRGFYAPNGSMYISEDPAVAAATGAQYVTAISGSLSSGITPAMAMLSAYSGTLVDEVGGYEAAHTRASHATVTDHYGLQTFAPNNLFLNSATLSTQNVTTVASNYIISFKGTGTITLSGTSTAGPIVGTGVSDRVYLKITPTAGTLTCMVLGSVTEAQIERVTHETVPRAYIATTGAVHYGYRCVYAPETLEASTTSITIGSGSSYTFTTAAAHSFAVGDVVQATDNADPDNWLWGYVTAASGTSVTLATYTFPGTAYSRPVRTNGSGTISDWSLIRVDGYLAEEARTNICLYSNDFTQTGWIASDLGTVSVTAGQRVGPDGQLSMSLIDDDSNSLLERLRRDITLASSTTYSVSFCAAAGTSNYLNVAMQDDVSAKYADLIMDLSDGSILTRQSGWVINGSGSKHLGGGLYYCWFTFTPDTTSGRLKVFPAWASSHTTTPDGATVGNCYVGFIQVEVGSSPTSYIPTAASSVARSADVASMTGTDFSGWWPGSGTLWMKAATPAVGDQTILKMDDTTANEVIEVYTSGTNPLLQITDGGSTQLAPLDLGTASTNVASEYAIRIAANNVNGAQDGTAVTADTGVTLPTVTRLLIGENGTAGDFMFFTSEEIDGSLETLTGG